MTMINRNFLALCLVITMFSGIWSACQNRQKHILTANDTIAPELSVLNQKIMNDPNNPKNYIERSKWFTDHNRPDSALLDVRKAIGLDSLNPTGYIALSEVYQFTGKFPEAERALLKARAIAPDDNEAIVAHARFYLVFKNYDAAFKLADEAIKKTPLNPKAYFVAGIAYLEKGDTLSGIKNLMNATAQDNQFFDAWVRLALISQNKQDQLAEGYFKNALRIHPKSKAAWYLIGYFYQERGDYTKAVAAYDSVLRIDSHFRDAIYNKGYIAMVVDEDYDRAIDFFSQSLQVSPGWTNALYNRGYANELKGEIEEAREDYQNVLKLDPQNEMAIRAMDRTDR
ncbi:MAG: hypothetical protein CVU06_02705 [Bacteroidetes bacterium HGW-Bacteroidetes-22]|nr:MAG: hypothetical protein CVU06_02705 [Bacteroidetes bacterium HGW-Bacteroidetes-22]